MRHRYEVWRLVRNWCDIPFPPFTSFDNWKFWSGSWKASKEKKHRFSVIFASPLWWLWRFRNSVTFYSHPMRKSDIFDNVRSSSFSWLVHRCRMAYNWSDWLKSPLLFSSVWLSIMLWSVSGYARSFGYLFFSRFFFLFLFLGACLGCIKNTPEWKPVARPPWVGIFLLSWFSVIGKSFFISFVSPRS